MTKFAVPVVAFVEAEDLDKAYQIVADTLSVHAFVRDAEPVPCILDERLDGFPLLAEDTEVYSALDHPANKGRK